MKKNVPSWATTVAERSESVCVSISPLCQGHYGKRLSVPPSSIFGRDSLSGVAPNPIAPAPPFFRPPLLFSPSMPSSTFPCCWLYHRGKNHSCYSTKQPFSLKTTNKHIARYGHYCSHNRVIITKVGRYNAGSYN